MQPARFCRIAQHANLGKLFDDLRLILCGLLQGAGVGGEPVTWTIIADGVNAGVKKGFWKYSFKANLNKHLEDVFDSNVRIDLRWCTAVVSVAKALFAIQAMLLYACALDIGRSKDVLQLTCLFAGFWVVFFL